MVVYFCKMEEPKLSTMVVLYNTNITFDTSKLMELLPINDVLIKIQKCNEKRGSSRKDQIKRRSPVKVKSNTGFNRNSITLVMLNNGDGTLEMKEITVKIFQDGLFHMTGVRGDAYDSSCINFLMDLLWKTCKEAMLTIPEKPEVLKRRCVMINYSTKFISSALISRETLHNSVRALNHEHIHSSYNPDVYPGVIIKIGPQKWCAKIFRTGKINLTGMTEHGECHAFIEALLQLLNEAIPTKPLKS